jgi:hypothetical protein
MRLRTWPVTGRTTLARGLQGRFAPKKKISSIGEMSITGVELIVPAPKSGARLCDILIGSDIGGQESLVMSGNVAMKLAAVIVKYPP